MASIYIEENYLDRLLVLVKQEQELARILDYHEILLKDYRSDLLQAYLLAIEKAGVKVNDRKQYQNLVTLLVLISYIGSRNGWKEMKKPANEYWLLKIYEFNFFNYELQQICCQAYKIVNTELI